MLTQKAFVRKAYDRYKNLDLKPGDPNDGCWEQAHYPLPQPEGKRWIWLLREDHLIQGVLQSEEEGRCCFYAPHCKQFLESKWVDNWFEIFDLYEKWASDHARQNGLRFGSKAGKKGGKIGGKIGGKRSKELGVGVHGRSPEQMTKDGKKGSKNTNGQKWMSLISGLISHSGGIGLHHKRLGSDPKSRIQLTEDQYQYLKDIPQERRLASLQVITPGDAESHDFVR